MDERALTDAELRAQIETARREGRRRAREPRAKSARYERETGRVAVELTNGCSFAFPAELAQGLRGAPTDALAEVELMMDGEALHWERLDADFLVSDLLRGIFGSERWMGEVARELGRRGGRSRSAAKTAAARRNGLKGGRPRGNKPRRP